jgi:hypothetical protein
VPAKQTGIFSFMGAMLSTSLPSGCVTYKKSLLSNTEPREIRDIFKSNRWIAFRKALARLVPNSPTRRIFTSVTCASNKLTGSVASYIWYNLIVKCWPGRSSLFFGRNVWTNAGAKLPVLFQTSSSDSYSPYGGLARL